MPSCFLAWQYLRKHRLQTAVMIAGVALALYLPLTTHWLINAFDHAIGARANQTPLILGARGSRFDLTLHALYFRAQTDGNLTAGDLANLRQKRARHLSHAIPIHSQYTARQKPVVGTTLDYFAFRRLTLAQGRRLALIGDAVIGSEAARNLNLAPGDKLKTDRQNLFDLAGQYPLQLNITGILAPAGTADDHAIFVDLKTSWIIAGIGHGHDKNATAPSPALTKTHLEITPENVFSFHFHGHPATRPLTAILVEPRNPKAMALIRGDYQNHPRLQALKPPVIVSQMMQTILRVRKFLDANHALIAATTTFLLALILLLSRRLRAREMETITLLGCSRRAILALQTAELAIILTAAASLALFAAWLTLAAANQYLKTLTA